MTDELPPGIELFYVGDDQYDSGIGKGYHLGYADGYGAGWADGVDEGFKKAEENFQALLEMREKQKRISTPEERQ